MFIRRFFVKIPLNSQMHNRLLSEAQAWFRLAEKLDWKSYDPMDFLGSPYLARVQSVSHFGARVFVQMGIRLGATSRRLLRIEHHEEAKTLSDYLSAAALFVKCGQTWAASYIEPLIIRLNDKAIVTPRGRGWGLEFPYSTRFVNAPARTPNLYQTSNAVQALLDAYAVTRNPEAYQSAISGIEFILNELGHFELGGHTWFRYWAGRANPIVNVQALSASLFARMGLCLGDSRMLELADRVAWTVISVQRFDGSWFYSVDDRANFVDSFHTGFILQGLTEYLQHRNSSAFPQTREAIQRGLAFFAKHLITSEGLPRYFADGPVEPDGQSFAQCIQTLVVCAPTLDHIEMALVVWKSMDKMLCMDGARHYRYGKGLSMQREPQLRWSIGPAVLATARVFSELGRTEAAEDRTNKWEG